MVVERVAVTGGNGTIGEAILAELSDHDFETVNLARGGRREDISDRYQSVDLLDAGAVYASLAQTDADAVVHMGTIPSPSRHPGHETYRSNVQTAYHVLEAADALGIDRVVLPSSINAMGAAFQDAPIEVEYLPVDEDHPLTPRDPYAVAKHAMEVTADGVARRPDGPTIASLRYPWVADGETLREAFEAWPSDPDEMRGERSSTTRDVLFSYLHLDDAASIARRAIEADLGGHERFWAVAGDTCVRTDSERLVEAFFDDVELRQSLTGSDAFVTTAKAEALLDWEPAWSWRR
ncbi:NAD-dependent epimerase/dehydratase family protein [Salinarchaeum laminariae]|uniref:NAD-dependent epimerase/dehydratase family protein n=1 Tax=Salinarchaeum laminariae TaxID=869888 RepID=UPI0020BFBE1F|nr:NAD(P)-dependent oxidoreductase [Salinarchaeum laminariae]